jgi:hypothetical protein
MKQGYTILIPSGVPQMSLQPPLYYTEGQREMSRYSENEGAGSKQMCIAKTHSFNTATDDSVGAHRISQ